MEIKRCLEDLGMLYFFEMDYTFSSFLQWGKELGMRHSELGQTETGTSPEAHFFQTQGEMLLKSCILNVCKNKRLIHLIICNLWYWHWKTATVEEVLGGGILKSTSVINRIKGVIVSNPSEIIRGGKTDYKVVRVIFIHMRTMEVSTLI